MKSREVYVCTSCGGRSLQWLGQCPVCHEWNTLQSQTVPSPAASRRMLSDPGAAPTVLTSFPRTPSQTGISSGLNELDHLLGEGFAPGQTVLLGGEPGIGKSTFLLQVAGQVAGGAHRSVYLTGEEPLAQIRDRADRLGVLNRTLEAVATSRVEDAVAVLDETPPPVLLIVDSVQTLTHSQAEGLPGSVGQVRAVATELIERAKTAGCAVVLVGHVTKDGQIAGPKILEHMVDTVLYLEGDRYQHFRILRVLKNRYGPNQDLLVLSMGARGLEIVQDPSMFFLDTQPSGVSGTAVVMAVEANRPFAVEVQALVTRSYLAIPRRTGVGIDAGRLHLLLAVLEKRLHLSFGQMDVYAKIGGGLRMQDPGLDLGLVAALLSSYHDRTLPDRAVFWGEVDLNGRIRAVAGQEIRKNQSRRLGLAPVFAPGGADGESTVDTVQELQRLLFGLSAEKSVGRPPAARPSEVTFDQPPSKPEER